MMKLYYALPEKSSPDLVSFLGSLDTKLREKLLKQFYLLMTHPLPGEPTRHRAVQQAV